MNNNKCTVSTVLSIISAIILISAAISAAVYFIMRYFEEKNQCDYIECDCFDDCFEDETEPEAIEEESAEE